ncbi:MAG: hypothetical protein LBC84_09830 [Prevotellaceae bacterium]|jgi:hypothetical protein|nr:hypothetical protein [Prevotellaceae bacterium]
MTKSIVLKQLFFENQQYAIFLAGVNYYEQHTSRPIFGLLRKATSKWEWYFIRDGDFMKYSNLKYMDDSYIYFMVDPSTIDETSLINMPFLPDNSEDIIILKCKLVSG